MDGAAPQPIEVPPEVSAATLEPISVTLAFSDTSRLYYVVYNEGQEPLNYTARVPSERFGVWRSDVPADDVEQRWFTAPPDATVLTLADDSTSEALPLGFDLALNGQRFDQIYVGANGLLTFQNFTSSYFVASCLPVPETLGPAIVPFRADLDPSQGGIIWAAQIEEGFVVSFEEVPLHSKPFDPDGPTYSFQVMLAHDGRIVFTYEDLAELPRELAVGIQYQHANQSVQSIGCGDEMPITSNLTLEMRPQPVAQSWIDTELIDSGTLLPGWGAMVRIDIDWTSPFGNQPYRSGVLFESNDPWYPSVRLPVYMTTEPAPHSVFLPVVVQGSGP
jgi:hypothetical protein